MEFTNAVFLGVGMESLLGEGKVCSRQTRITTKKGLTFDPTVVSRSIFYRSFQRLFSWSRYAIATRCRGGLFAIDQNIS
jgi:hypothetical protein